MVAAAARVAPRRLRHLPVPRRRQGHRDAIVQGPAAVGGREGGRPVLRAAQATLLLLWRPRIAVRRLALELDDPSTISRSAHRACCPWPPLPHSASSCVVRAPTPPDQQQAGRQERRAARACQLLARAAAGGVARRPRRRRPVARGDGPPGERLVAQHVESTAAQTSARSFPGPTRSGRSRPRAAPGFGHPWPVSRLEPWLVVQTGLAPLNTGGTRNTRRGCARPSSAAPSRETGGRAASRRPCSPAACRWS